MDARLISWETPELIAALEAANLPTEDLGDEGRTFYAFEDAGQPIGFAGFELYGEDVLLRSVLVLPDARGRGYGMVVTEAVLARAGEAGGRHAYLLTMTAESFFARGGFTRIAREAAPASILATRQAATICSTAALLTRPIARND